MFRHLAEISGSGGAAALFEMHPAELAALMELYWNLARAIDPTQGLGHPLHRSDVRGVPDSWSDLLLPTRVGATVSLAQSLATSLRRQWASKSWDHLIYAYMIENTRIFEIFRRVVVEFLHGEKLGVPSAATQNWLRATEELFFKSPPPFSAWGVFSDVRSDLRATRRTAYHRLFGMDLNHGADDNKSYPYTKADAANNEFVSTFEEFLREVWVGMVNREVTIGPKPTDDQKISNLAGKLHDMLLSRRLNGNLAREEFFFVAMMSWFHLTVESDLPIIVDLKAVAGAAGPEQRLFKIAQLVGLPAHGLSHSYFDLASPLSAVLTAIESDLFRNTNDVPILYNPAVGSPSLEPLMRIIVNHWSIITGRDVKAGKVATS